ncbi:hypothetical protein NKH81_32885 [Mesorhizobium sp. M0959]|uniref:hypothetical protein n=1 Tax=Mesorhizobium sp. M0959 TaxID=2957034 RepID=UPI00333CC216
MTPGYHCPGKVAVDEGRGVHCLNVDGGQIDEAVVAAFLEALEPVRLTATLEAAKRLENDREAAATSRLTVALPRSRPATVRTYKDTLALLLRLAPHYPDAGIAGVLTARGPDGDIVTVGGPPQPSAWRPQRAIATSTTT